KIMEKAKGSQESICAYFTKSPPKVIKIFSMGTRYSLLIPQSGSATSFNRMIFIPNVDFLSS
ncbi:MAG: hypothetical protein AAFU64_05025, partial [Bacteroidota bacterium]